MKWQTTPVDEQETIVNIDYYDKTINVYTTRKAVGERLVRKLGEPTKVHKTDSNVYAVEYVRSLFDKDVSKFFSKMLLVGAYRKQDDEDE